MEQSQWVLCPCCGGKTRIRIRKDTVLQNFPLYCPKCGREHLISAEGGQVHILKSQTQ